MVTSPVGSSYATSYYSGASTGSSSTNTASGSGLTPQESITQQLDSSLINSLSQPDTSVAGMSDYPTNLQQAVQDQVTLANNPSLAQMISQMDTPSAVLPTNLQQTVQDQLTLATNPSLVQTISQQAASPLLEPMTEALQTLPAGNGSTQSGQSLTSLASSMQMLQDLTNSGTLASNPSLAQSLLDSYTSSTNPTTPGSLVNTSA